MSRKFRRNRKNLPYRAKRPPVQVMPWIVGAAVQSATEVSVELTLPITTVPPDTHVAVMFLDSLGNTAEGIVTILGPTSLLIDTNGMPTATILYCYLQWVAADAVTLLADGRPVNVSP